jgi:uncharacterized protein with GYD domain
MAGPGWRVERYGRDDIVPTYVSLLNYTEQGIRTLKDSPERQQQAEQHLQQLGGRFIDHYLTMGAYDYVLVWEAVPATRSIRATDADAGAGGDRTSAVRTPAHRHPLRQLGG